MAKKQVTLTLDMEKLGPVFIGLTIVLAFVVGILWQRVSNLESGGGSRVGTGTAQGTGGDAGGHAAAPPTQGKLSDDQASNLEAVGDHDRVKGNRDAKVFIVEYSDLECPFCQRFHGTAQQAVDDYGGDVAWVYRHFPLDTIHPRAQAAALASECAFQLGGNDGFWAYIDEVFANQTTALSDLSGTAEAVGLNKSQFDSCVADGSASSSVDDDYQKGLSAGVTGTPGNFIINQNGDAWILPGAVPIETLRATIDLALEG